jgi:hypothetical protein
MTHTQEQFDRLPKWAKEELRHMDREVQAAQAQVKKILREIDTPSETTFVRAAYGFDDIPLAKHERIVFKVDNGEIRAWVDEQGLVNIQSNAYMGGDLIIRPRVSNVVTAQIWEF